MLTLTPHSVVKAAELEIVGDLVMISEQVGERLSLSLMKGAPVKRQAVGLSHTHGGLNCYSRE